jgi:four helix bundle protein
MRITLRQQLLTQVLSFVAAIRPLVEKIARHDRDLARQARNAANSVGLNVAEGLGSEGGNMRVHIERARGSLLESVTALRHGQAWGYVSAADVDAAARIADNISARLFGLARR